MYQAPAATRRKRHPLAKIKGCWTAEEDAELIRLVQELGEGNWSPISRALNAAVGKDESNGRIGKQCRERWNHHLRPDIKKDAWNRDEEELLVRAHNEMGNRWSDIAKTIPGRSENAVKNHWNATLRRRDLPDPDPGPLKVYMQGLNLIRPQARARRPSEPAPRSRNKTGAGNKRRTGRRGGSSDSYTSDEPDSSDSSQDNEDSQDATHRHIPYVTDTSGAGMPLATGRTLRTGAISHCAPPLPPVSEWRSNAQFADPCINSHMGGYMDNHMAQHDHMAQHLLAPAGCEDPLQKRRRVEAGQNGGEVVAGEGGPVGSQSTSAASTVGQEADSRDGGAHNSMSSLGTHTGVSAQAAHAGSGSGNPGDCLPGSVSSVRGNTTNPYGTDHSAWPPAATGLYTTGGHEGLGWQQGLQPGQPPSIYGGGRQRLGDGAGLEPRISSAGNKPPARTAGSLDAQHAAALRDLTMSPGALALEAALSLAGPSGLGGGTGAMGNFLLDSDDVELIEMLSMANQQQQQHQSGHAGGGGGGQGVPAGAGGGLSVKVKANMGAEVVMKTEGHEVLDAAAAMTAMGNGNMSWCGMQATLKEQQAQAVTRSGSNSSLHSSYSVGPNSPACSLAPAGTNNPTQYVGGLSAGNPLLWSAPPLPPRCGPDPPMVRVFKDGACGTLVITTSALPGMDALLKRHMATPPADSSDASGSLVTLKMGSKGPIRVCLPELASQLSAAGLPSQLPRPMGAGTATDCMVADLARMLQYVCNHVVRRAGLESYLVAIKLGCDTPHYEYSVLLAVRGRGNAQVVGTAVEAISSGLAPLLC